MHPEAAPSIVLLGGMLMLAPLSLDLYLPAFPEAARSLDATGVEMQLTLTANLVGLGLGQLLAGGVSDARGRRGPLLAGLLAFTAASLCCALSTSVWLLIAMRLVQGAAGAAGIVIARAIVRDRHSGAEAARVFGMLGLVMGLAPILAPAVGGALLGVTNWRGLFVVLAAFGGVLTVATWLTLVETLPVELRHTGGTRRSLAAFLRLACDRTFVGYALAYSLLFGAVFSYISASAFAYQAVYGVSPTTYGLLVAVGAVGLVLGTQAGGRLAHRWGSTTLLASGLVIAVGAGAVILVLALQSAPLQAVVPAVFVLMVGWGLVVPSSFALALENHASSAGSASALIGASQFMLGALVVPLVAAAGTDTLVPFSISVLVLSVAALAAWWLLVPHGQAAVE